MRLTPTERDRLLLYTAADLARRRLATGVLLNVPEATAIIADTVIEAARRGDRLLDACNAGRTALHANQVMPGVLAIVTEVKVEAVFDDGTRLVVVRDPFGVASDAGSDNTGLLEAPGEVMIGQVAPITITSADTIEVVNTSDVPVSITSHFHFFEVNRRLLFPRIRAYGMRLGIPAGDALRFEPGVPTAAPLVPFGGDRVAIGFAGLVDGPLDDPSVRDRAVMRARDEGYLGV
jgi:urease subunit gamma/beta